jgi:hypothetical protein
MYRNGNAYMHFQSFLLDNGQTQLNVWYHVVDDTGTEELAGERHTSGSGDWVITALEQALRNAGILTTTGSSRFLLSGNSGYQASTDEVTKQALYSLSAVRVGSRAVNGGRHEEGSGHDGTVPSL